MSRSALIAVGGNSLIRAGQKGTIDEQKSNAQCVSRSIMELVGAGMEIVLTHGNGPQVGAALLRSERAAGQVYEHGLDVCVAATQGEIGYLMQQSLQEESFRIGGSRPVITIVSQVVVSADDPAFHHPSKPVGPFYSQADAEAKRRNFGWDMVEDAARGFRRVVPSPEPLEIVEEEAIRSMLRGGMTVIALGGGGIPVVRERGRLRGVDAVVDKDLASELLARRLPVETLVFATDADHVYVNYRRPGQRALTQVSAAEVRRLHEEGHFPPGSMGPKIEASLNFLDAGGKEVFVTSNRHLAAALRGAAGTRITA